MIPLLTVYLVVVMHVLPPASLLTPDGSADWLIDLNGKDWLLSNSNKSIQVSATVPGSVYTDLMSAGVLDDPYYRFNDIQYRWVALENWTYTRNFTVSKPFQRRDVVWLILEGIDTVATVDINGVQVLATDNMFRKYVVGNIKAGPMQIGNNIIRLKFTSPVMFAAGQAKAYPYVVPQECPPPEQHGECHVNFIRKEQCSFSWDWGPSFPTVGIWKDIRIEAHKFVKLNYITTETIQESDKWILILAAYMDIDLGGWQDRTVCTVEMKINIPALNVTKDALFVVQIGSSMAVTYIDVPKSTGVSPWWPNGHGEPTLYDMQLRYRYQDPEAVWYSQTLRIGFRTMELVQQTIEGSTGLSFYFKINDVPIFMKGSNWIPADAFQERITPQYLRRLLESAKEANMNMLRVWGGGIYESDTFYGLADELGILIWQDMTFACSLYPTNKDFLYSIKKEVTHQVKRLMYHPSIAIWSANNENEWMLAPFKNSSLYSRYYEDYLSLYKNTVASAVRLLDRSRPFVSSSPSDGQETFKEGWVADNPQDNHYGDVHHYDYFADSWNWKNYPTPRFASEYGFQSWCSLEALKNISIPSDWSMSSKFTQHRQHHPQGHAQLVHELSQHLNLSESTEPQQQFEDFIYLTQINQAVGIKTETEHYRCHQSDLVEGEGMTMGALYWQLNDIWQAPTWASIEYGGKWKMLHYYAKKFFAKELISPILDGSTLSVYYINDQIPHSHDAMHSGQYKNHKQSQNMFNIDSYNNNWADSKDTSLRFKPHHQDSSFSSETSEQSGNLNLSIKLYTWSMLEPVQVWNVPFKMPSLPSSVIFQENIDKLLAKSCPSYDHCILLFSHSPDGSTESVNWLLLSNFTTAVGIQKPNLRASQFIRSDDFTVQFTLTTDGIAPFVWMEMTEVQGHFNDNGFIMTDHHMTITFSGWQKIPEDVQSLLKIRSLKG